MPTDRRPLFGLALAGAAVSFGIAAGTGVTSTLRTVPVTASEFAFAPDEIFAAPAEELTIELANTGAFPHNIVFVLPDEEVGSETVGSGESTSLTFDAPGVGDYTFYCAIADHRERGMEGVLRVEEQEPPQFELFADGLKVPHGLFVDGTSVLVSEGGTSTDDVGNADGRVTMIALDDPDDRTVLVDGLSNSGGEGSTVGANHAIWREPADASQTALVALSGGPTHPEPRAQILVVEPGTAPQVLADVLAYEEANNPDGGVVDSNPWYLAYGPDERVYISDAGANAVFAMDSQTGDLSTYAVFQPVGPDGSRDPVPTGMQWTDDGLYVSLLGSFASETGQLRLLTDENSDGDAMDDGENTLVVDGLTLAVDVKQGPSGDLYVLQYYGTFPPPTPGRLVRIVDDGFEPVVEGLSQPSGMAFTPSGDLLVSNAPDRVVRITAETLGEGTAPTSTPTATEAPPQATRTPTATATEAGPTIYLPRVWKTWELGRP
jgi:plastocyanin